MESCRAGASHVATPPNIW